jgi:hypothetical protein
MTFDEYMAFFDKWLNYQFSRAEDETHNKTVLQIVAQIVADSDELAHWANRDNWSMYDHAKQFAPVETI